ncbi:MAG: TPR end-of-group domain-containing protein [Gemmataceae bacterium]
MTGGRRQRARRCGPPGVVACDGQAGGPGADAAKLARDHADRSVRWLHKAVQAGFKDADHMKKEADFGPLRERPDFKELLAEVEANPTKPGEAKR